ncbi:MAG: class I SAM-dependent methyltransferase [Pseudomonadota bacterium]
MDDVTDKVAKMYAEYPYPSPSVDAGKEKLTELANLFKFLALETKYDYAQKSVLDAGVGTGQRLAAAAESLSNTRFTGIDMVQSSLEVARQVSDQAGLSNVDFHCANILEDMTNLGAFDIVLCMGVLHHLSKPHLGLKNLHAVLKDDGFVLLYLYGLRGAQERMRRKAVISLLRGGRQDDLAIGIRLAKDLEYDDFEYGWNINIDQATNDSFIVDAFMNVNERLFDAETIHELAVEAGFHAYVTYGITTGTQGLLFDTRLESKRSFISQMSLAKRLKADLPKDLYGQLSLRDRYRLVDLLYDPNGYTVIMLTEGAREKLSRSARIGANVVEV